MKAKVKVSGVILASGSSTRMGENKLLLEWQGSCVICRVMDAAAKAGFFKVLVVSSYDPILDMAREKGLTAIKNHHPRLGQSQSVVLGTQACAAADGIMYIPGDMPFLTSSVLRRLKDAFCFSPEYIIRPVYGQKPGAPAIFPRKFFNELQALKGDKGGKEVIRKYPQWVRMVAVEDGKAGIDIDTPKDVEKWLERGDRIEN
ncbi:MAG TPA: nucleotidyltransferase family protein [Candidatus Scybalocola faecavium]|nr:nucleotidyltransferase family protein [Candidatus Scybalocola faecavium]